MEKVLLLYLILSRMGGNGWEWLGKQAEGGGKGNEWDRIGGEKPI